MKIPPPPTAKVATMAKVATTTLVTTLQIARVVNLSKVNHPKVVIIILIVQTVDQTRTILQRQATVVAVMRNLQLVAMFLVKVTVVLLRTPAV